MSTGSPRNDPGSGPLIQLRPRGNALYISQDRTVLSTDLDGLIAGGSDHGLFVHETRLLSLYQYRINGEKPFPVALSNVEQHSWLGYYVLLPPEIPVTDPETGSGLVDPASENTLEMRLTRSVAQGVHEDVDLTSFSYKTARVDLELEVDADFADQIETRGERQQRGQLDRAWREVEGNAWELVFDYRAEHAYDQQGNTGTARIHRCLTLRVENCTSPPTYAEGVIRFQVEINPRDTWHTCIKLIPWIDGQEKADVYPCHPFGGGKNAYDRRREIFLSEATGFTAPGSDTLSGVVIRALEQAKRDLAALRLYDLDRGERAWTVAAGLPVYVALFGRDTLTAAWGAALASPDMMRGAPVELARWQGAVVNDWRDEQPGKMLHEAHTGPLEMLNYNPRSRYYGSITTSGFFPVVVSELWHWTGDKTLVDSLLEPMLKALRWLDRYGDINGDGFYEYQTHSTQGNRNQAWKDSRDGIVYEDGSLVDPPIATCEEQGFVYLAKIRAAELLWVLGDKEEAKRYFHEAGELKKKFNEAFWMESEGYYAMGLDAAGRQIQAIGSNPGHCLATAIVDPEHVLRTSDRMFSEDLFSGWGIRTLSTHNPAFNPYSYHRGSVWPVEQATFAIGLMRYGLHERTQQLSRAQFDAAKLFMYNRLPEVFSGHARDERHPFPAIYPQTNSPQAWSASAVFSFVQAMVGIYPYAPLSILLVDPHLPDWLPEITLHHLRVGQARVTLRFYRKEDGSSDYRVLEQDGTLHIFRQPSPWSLTASFGERVEDFLTSLLPGR